MICRNNSNILKHFENFLKKYLLFLRTYSIILKYHTDGQLVKRLRRRPLTAETGVRFPYWLLNVFIYSPTHYSGSVRFGIFFAFRDVLQLELYKRCSKIKKYPQYPVKVLRVKLYFLLENRYNSSVVCVINVIFNFLCCKSSYKSFCLGTVNISFAYGNNICICLCSFAGSVL